MNIYLSEKSQNVNLLEQKMKQVKSMRRRTTSAAAFTLAFAFSNAPAYAAGFDVANIKVSTPGVYELSIQALADSGIDLRGVALSRFGLSNGPDGDIPIEVIDDGNGVADFGDAFRFIGQGVDTLYTDQRSYTLKLDAGIARMQVYDAPVPAGPSAPSYMAERKFAPQNVYSLTSPTDDPWYAKQVLAYQAAAEEVISLQTDAFVAGAYASRLKLKLWGESDLEGSPADHHVEILVNGAKVSDAVFDGVSSYTINEALDTDLSSGLANVTVRLPADTGYLFDIVNIDEVSLSYPRQFLADGKKLEFSSQWPKYRIGGFESSDIAVYTEQPDGQISRISNALSGGDCSPVTPVCEAMFGGVSGEAQYYVVTRSGLLSPEIKLPLAYADIDVSAETVVIAHPDFIGLSGQPLETYVSQLSSEREGGAALVDVEQIYAQYSDGEFGAAAIAAYIRDAYARGARSVVLVGGDVFDYRDYKNTRAVSFIPSLYVATNEIVRFTPSDPKYADVDGDNIPDMAIARIPVHNAFELRAMLDKRNDYLSNNYSNKVLFTADKTSELDQYDFGESSDQLIDQYFSDWQVTRAYLDDMEVAQASALVSSTINAGTALTVYSGHSSANQLSFEGLFDGADAAALDNVGSPTIITQWGCWNTYNVNPETRSMSHKFLLEGRQGAVAVIGSSVVVKASAEQQLADLFYAELVGGKTLGDAMLAAKRAYVKKYGPDLDILLGITEMGFPHLRLR